jgi:hypothetical protein
MDLTFLVTVVTVINVINVIALITIVTVITGITVFITVIIIMITVVDDINNAVIIDTFGLRSLPLTVAANVSFCCTRSRLQVPRPRPKFLLALLQRYLRG